jgi:hypothetical protein
VCFFVDRELVREWERGSLGFLVNFNPTTISDFKEKVSTQLSGILKSEKKRIRLRVAPIF